jgi:hypothetical protein
VINKASALLLGAVISTGWCAAGQKPQRYSKLVPGGIPGLPTITGETYVSNTVTVTWDGPSGYYQLYQITNLATPRQPVGSPYNLLRTATVTNPPSPVFWQVAGTTSPYLGGRACAECHQDKVDTVIHTQHAGAYTNALFVTLGGQTNGACLVCHTVGYGAPTGFTNNPVRPQLTGVQCENCHGPAANHASNPSDPTAVPRVELAGTMCGGCHNTQLVPPQVAALHPPLYEEWNTSAHHEVLPELQADFASNPSVYISTCGRCHSGSVREALMEDYAVLPDAAGASAVGIVCSTCHDPHEQSVYTNVIDGSVYTNQVINPLSSLQDYHTTGNWATNYNPDINLCAQCHNDRGASWKDTSRPPHHSPQYNILIGTSGVLNTNTPNAAHFNPGTHGLRITNQCVSCHMQTPTPASSGHSFEVTSYNVCAGAACHGSPANAIGAIGLAQYAVTNRINTLHAVLDLWALTQAPAIIGTTNYGVRAWEYTTPGELSPPGLGPDANEQKLIPDIIKMARYNLYLVLYDGSVGVHNGLYDVNLLDTTLGWFGVQPKR